MNKSKINKILTVLIIVNIILGIVLFLRINKNNKASNQFTLEGEQEIIVGLGAKYKDPGFLALENDVNINDQVVVSGNVDTSKEGTYVLVYEVSINGKIKELKRVVKVVNRSLLIEFTPNTKEYTNEDIELSINITGEKFDYIELPDGNKVYETSTKMTLSESNIYTFTAYNKEEVPFVYTFDAFMIDKEEPEGVCTATVFNDHTEVEVEATDNGEILEYNYLDNKTSFIKVDENKVSYPKKTGKEIYVDIIDKATNTKNIKCELIDKSFKQPILPSSSDNVVKKEEKDSLKVYIIKKSGYYVTRIWVKNPYMQLNKFDSPEYGKNFYNPVDLLKKADSKYNLSKKLVVAFNGSGMYKAGSWDGSSVNFYSGYDKTSVGTVVITDGKVIRSVPDKACKTWFTVGVNKDNKMLLFHDEAIYKSYNKNKLVDGWTVEKKQKWAQEVIDSGIRNTFTFASPLIENGKASDITTSMPSPTSPGKNCNAICQIDENNFALITGGSLNRKRLISEMEAMNCITGENLDGGGSIALIYKSSTDTNYTKVIGAGRSLTEVGFFTEE